MSAEYRSKKIMIEDVEKAVGLKCIVVKASERTFKFLDALALKIKYGGDNTLFKGGKGADGAVIIEWTEVE